MNTMTHQTQIFPIASSNIYAGNINVDNLFDMAISFANEGLKAKAIETAREALIFAKQQNAYTMVYIHSFLASMCLDEMKSTHARIHCYNAMNRLDKNRHDYKTDKQYLDTLMSIINRADTKVKQLEFDALAA